MSSAEADDRGVILTCPHCDQRNRIPYERVSQTTARCHRCQNELPALREPVDVGDETVFTTLVERSARPVLVDFWAPWCGPCKMMAPELDRVATEAADRWWVVKVNTETVPRLAQRYRITGIPLLILFNRGRELARRAGAMPATAIRQWIESNVDSEAR